MREPKNPMLGTMDPILMQLSVKNKLYNPELSENLEKSVELQKMRCRNYSTFVVWSPETIEQLPHAVHSHNRAIVCNFFLFRALHQRYLQNTYCITVYKGSEYRNLDQCLS